MRSKKFHYFGSLLGGMLGAVMAQLTAPAGTLPIAGIVSGLLIGSILGGLIGTWLARPIGLADHIGKQDAKLLLREEELDIIKKRLKTGEVTAHTETIEEEKVFTVPVTREELVIQVAAASSTLKTPDIVKDTYRIPLREEQIEIIKHPVELNDVNIFRQHFEETEHIEELLKKEEPRVEITGHPLVTDSDKSR
jgi:uncharacterized protein (TIGR02271 family)